MATKTQTAKTQYRIEYIQGAKERGLLAAHNELYVAAFLRDMNERRIVKHRLDPVAPHRIESGGWSLGIQPRFYDGRVTGASSCWVYARKEADMPEGALAAVWLMFPAGHKVIGHVYAQPNTAAKAT